jgi:dolichol kinase
MEKRTRSSVPDVSRDPLAPLRDPDWLSEAQRKTLHLAAIVLPLWILFQPFPWPRTHRQWVALLLVLTAFAITVDVIRIHDHRVRRFFGRFFGGLMRRHEQFSLTGATYLLLASLLALELFPRPFAAAAIGFTILGDGMAALVGRAYGRVKFFNKTLEGALGGLVACLAWAALLAGTGFVPWNIAACGALAASLVEILPIPLDDNLGITLVSGYVMRLLWTAS